MRGLDPRIHLKKRCSITMDCRVKPGNDSRDRCHSRLWGGQREKRAPPFRIGFWKDGGARRSCAMANSGKTRHCELGTGLWPNLMDEKGGLSPLPHAVGGSH